MSLTLWTNGTLDEITFEELGSNEVIMRAYGDYTNSFSVLSQDDLKSLHGYLGNILQDMEVA